MVGAPKIFGPYELLSPLGQGAMGDVWLARPLDPARGLPSPLVVKRLHAELAVEERVVRRFTHEARIATAIDCPNVAKVYDVGSVGNLLYIAMEHIVGWPLARVMQDVKATVGRISVASALDIVFDALHGLDALHSARDARGASLQIVHRDVTPRNIMLAETGSACLID